MAPACHRRYSVANCPKCGAEPDEGCPLATLDDSLLNPTTAVGGVTGATCDLEEGVCESCQ